MRLPTAALAAFLLVPALLPARARADNQIGYHLLPPDQAASLPHNGGALGMDIRRGQVITDAGMTFELLRVASVRPRSAGAQAGFKPGDQIIAVDGTVFPSLQAFASYVGSLPPGHQITVDYLPVNGGPQQAQRIGVTVGNGAMAAQAAAHSGGLSTGEKLAIGAGAVALFGCYEMGCFSHTQTPARPPTVQQPVTQQPVTQQ